MIGVTVKLSFAVFGLCMCLVALLALYSHRGKLKSLMRPVCTVALLAVVLLLPWCARGLILNGYPAHPAKVMRFDREWTVSGASCDAMRMQIKNGARIPDVPPEQVLHTGSWFRPWIENIFRNNVFDVRLPLMTIMLAFVLFGFQRRQGPPLEKRRILLLCMPCIVALGCWFWSAPDPRFLGSTTWVLAATLLTLALQHHRAWALPVVLTHALMLIAGLVNPVDGVHTWTDRASAQRVPMQTRISQSGLGVHVASDGDQCWDAELPCTPYFSPRLALRDSRTMRKGFVKRHKLVEGQ